MGPVATVFTEVAHRVWVARYPWYDVNVAVVGAARGLLVVDTHGSAAHGRAVVSDVRGLGAGEVVAVVNTHEHFDHTFGNLAFREAFGPVPIHAHETAAARTAAAGERIRREYAASMDRPFAAEVLATEVIPGDVTFSSTRVLDLGDRLVELIHPGRGHTGGDLVVRIPDADALLAGDLVEESGPPGFGDDCYPLEWPGALDLMLALTTSNTVVVPGHGSPVGRDFLADQRASIGVVADTIRDLAGRGVPAADALAAAAWPYPVEVLADAVRRGYAQLPPSARRLPMHG